MSKKHFILAVGTAVILLMAAFTGNAAQVTELKYFPIDKNTKIITGSGVSFDKKISSDGNGSLKINAVQGKTVVQLFELKDLNVENAQLTYQARIRTKNVQGGVYLEMWCGFTGQGEFFSKNLNSIISGTNDWTTVMTPFFLKLGEKPDYLKLNVVVEGKGTAWIDDIRLFKATL